MQTFLKKKNYTLMTNYETMYVNDVCGFLWAALVSSIQFFHNIYLFYLFLWRYITIYHPFISHVRYNQNLCALYDIIRYFYQDRRPHFWLKENIHTSQPLRWYRVSYKNHIAHVITPTNRIIFYLDAVLYALTKRIYLLNFDNQTMSQKNDSS